MLLHKEPMPLNHPFRLLLTARIFTYSSYCMGKLMRRCRTLVNMRWNKIATFIDKTKWRLDIYFQMSNLVAVNKPAGLLVHRTNLAKDEEDAVVQKLRDQTGKWFSCHRLTEELAVYWHAFKSEVARIASTQFAESKHKKTYQLFS